MALELSYMHYADNTTECRIKVNLGKNRERNNDEKASYVGFGSRFTCNEW